MVGHGRESPVEALVQGRQQEHVSLPQWDIQVGSVGCPGGLSLSRLSWSWSYFQSFMLPHLMKTVEKDSISERLLGLCLTETELGGNKQITISRVRSCSPGQNHSGQQPELSVDQGGSSWHGRDEAEQAHTSSPAPSLDGHYSPLTTSKLLGSAPGFFLPEDNPCENIALADLPTGQSVGLL